MLYYFFNLKYLNQQDFVSQFFSCKHKVYVLMGFKSHIEKIKYSSSIYVVNCNMS